MKLITLLSFFYVWLIINHDGATTQLFRKPVADLTVGSLFTSLIRHIDSDKQVEDCMQQFDPLLIQNYY